MTDMNPNDESLDGIFDDVSPEDFALAGSAISETPAADIPLDAFVGGHIQSLRISFAQSLDGLMRPLAVLSNGQADRTFVLDDREKLIGEFYARLTQEARRMGATRMFFAFQTEVALFDGEDDGEPPRVEAVITGADYEPAVYFYGGDVTDEGVDRLQGFLTVVDNSLGDQKVVPADQPVRLDSVLLWRSS